MRYISEKWQQRWECARRLTNESSLPVGRDRKIRTALRTNQMAGFVTMSSEKNKYIYLHIINMKIYIYFIYFFQIATFLKTCRYIYITMSLCAFFTFKICPSSGYWSRMVLNCWISDGWIKLKSSSTEKPTTRIPKWNTFILLIVPILKNGCCLF